MKVFVLFFSLARRLLDVLAKAKSLFKARPQKTVTHPLIMVVFVVDHPGSNGKVSKIAVPNQPKPEEEPPPSNP